MQKYRLKGGIEKGTALMPMPGINIGWLRRCHNDRPLVFEGVTDRFGTEGHPEVKIGDGRATYSHFVATLDGQPIDEPVVEPVVVNP